MQHKNSADVDGSAGNRCWRRITSLTAGDKPSSHGTAHVRLGNLALATDNGNSGRVEARTQLVFLTACRKLSIVFVEVAGKALGLSEARDAPQLLEDNPFEPCGTLRIRRGRALGGRDCPFH
jgi:hypothetical protein